MKFAAILVPVALAAIAAASPVAPRDAAGTCIVTASPYALAYVCAYVIDPNPYCLRMCARPRQLKAIKCASFMS